MPGHAMQPQAECKGCFECADWRPSGLKVQLPPVPAVVRCHRCPRPAVPGTACCLRCAQVAAYQAPPVPYYPEVR